jgi:hypothetical protein
MKEENKPTYSELTKENSRVMNKIAKILRESILPRAWNIGILEVLKTDMIINGGCISLDGRELLMGNK